MSNSKRYGGLETFWETPPHLSERAATLWGELVPSETRSPERLALLQTALECLDTADQCTAQLEREGLTVKAFSGRIQANPCLKIRGDAMKQFLSCWRALGLERAKGVDDVPLSQLETQPHEPEEYPNVFAQRAQA